MALLECYLSCQLSFLFLCKLTLSGIIQKVVTIYPEGYSTSATWQTIQQLWKWFIQNQKCHPQDGGKVITIHLLGTMNICKRPAPDISAWTKVLDRYPQSLAAASLKSDAAFSSSNIKIIAERHIVSPCKPDLTYCSWMDNWCQENFILHFKHTKNLPLHANPPLLSFFYSRLTGLRSSSIALHRPRHYHQHTSDGLHYSHSSNQMFFY